MQASSFWKRFIGTVDSDDLADLRRDMILEIGVVAFVIGWLTTLAAIGYEGRLEYLPTALILLAGSMASFLLRPTHYQVALHVLIATVLCAITCLKWFVADRLAPTRAPRFPCAPGRAYHCAIRWWSALTDLSKRYKCSGPGTLGQNPEQHQSQLPP